MKKCVNLKNLDLVKLKNYLPPFDLDTFTKIFLIIKHVKQALIIQHSEFNKIFEFLLEHIVSVHKFFN